MRQRRIRGNHSPTLQLAQPMRYNRIVNVVSFNVRPQSSRLIAQIQTLCTNVLKHRASLNQSRHLPISSHVDGDDCESTSNRPEDASSPWKKSRCPAPVLMVRLWAGQEATGRSREVGDGGGQDAGRAAGGAVHCGERGAGAGPPVLRGFGQASAHERL